MIRRHGLRDGVVHETHLDPTGVAHRTVLVSTAPSVRLVCSVSGVHTEPLPRLIVAALTVVFRQLHSVVFVWFIYTLTQRPRHFGGSGGMLGDHSRCFGVRTRVGPVYHGPVPLHEDRMIVEVNTVLTYFHSDVACDCEPARLFLPSGDLAVLVYEGDLPKDLLLCVSEHQSVLTACEAELPTHPALGIYS